MTGLLDDIRHGVAALRRRLGLVIVAVLTLGLGIGVSTTLFALLLPQLYEMPPVAGPDRLSVLLKVNPALGIERGRPALSEYLEWRDSRSYEALAAIHERDATLALGGGTRRVDAHRVTASFFDTIGVTPARGRAFRPDETVPGARPVAIISHDLWRGVFRQDPAVLGRTIDLDDEPHVVVGVMPEGFWFVVNGIDIWTPLPIEQVSTAGQTYVMVVGRRRSDTSWEQAQAEVDTLTSRTSPRDVAAGWRTSVVPLPKEATKRVSVAAVAFMPALLVLLIGCVNVANLLLASAVTREHEMAVRTAIGATRGRLIRQLFTESLWLAAGGGLVGLVFTFWGVELLHTVLGRSQPMYAARITIAPSVLAVALLTTMITPLIFGLAPAGRASSPRIGELLKDSLRSERLVRGYRLRDLLVPLQLALAVILLVTTGLFLRFAWEQEHLPLGFDDERLYALTVASRTAGRAPSNPAELNLPLLEQVREVPGVEAAAVADGLPAGGIGRGARTVTLDETAAAARAGLAAVNQIAVTPGFFATMGIPLPRGRDFSSDDALGSEPVVIVSEHLARRWWPDRDPIGRAFRLGGFGAPDRHLTVIGVAGDVMTSDTLQSPYVYVPLAQAPSARVVVVTRVTREPPDPIALKQAVARVAPLRLDEVWSVQERLANQFRGADFTLWLFGVLAGLALLLAAIGVYTVVSQSVARRRREIGIRLALGASRVDIVRAVVGPTLALSAVGIATGAGGTLVVTRFTWSLLLNVSATSPVVWLAIVGVLALAAVLACAAPVRRAVSVDPAVVLRQN